MARFIIDYTFDGRGSESIEADSLEAAQAFADAKVDDEYFEPPADDFDDIRVTVRELHPVTRAGREIWSSYVASSDIRGHESALKTSPLFAESA